MVGPFPISAMHYYIDLKKFSSVLCDLIKSILNCKSIFTLMEWSRVKVKAEQLTSNSGFLYEVSFSLIVSNGRVLVLLVFYSSANQLSLHTSALFWSRDLKF